VELNISHFHLLPWKDFAVHLGRMLAIGTMLKFSQNFLQKKLPEVAGCIFLKTVARIPSVMELSICSAQKYKKVIFGLFGDLAEDN
jgi:hypothetical protein